MKKTNKDVVGTSFHGSIVSASVNQLIDVLGEPIYDGNTGNDKINFEWEMEFESGDVFTVYDWKEYRTLDLDEVVEWHIGGFSKDITDEAADLIQHDVIELESSQEHNTIEVYSNKLTQDQIKKLASEMVGDGQNPNKFFVTVSPCIIIEGDFYDFKSELLDGFTKEDMDTQMFDTFEEANEYYESIDLDPHEGIGTVIMEDRKTGVIKQKELSKVVRVDYSYNEYDDAKTFGYTK